MTAAATMGVPEGRVLQACRFALDPTPTQAEQLRSHCGAQRFAYNWGLRLVKANLDQRAAERSYRIAERDLAPPLNWSAYALRKMWNQVKDEIAPWWPENSKESYSSGLVNLATGLSNWAGSRSGRRKGQRVRFPRFKTKKSALSCRFTTGSFGLADGTDRRHIKLPRIGSVRTHESTRKLARRISAGGARIRSATISFSRGRWFVSFSVEVQRTISAATAGSDAVVGIDLGVRHLAVLSVPVPEVSDGDGMVANPAHLEHAQRALRRLQRQAARRRGPDKRSRVTQSKRWERTHAKVTRLHARVANARTDALHQLTTTLVERCRVIVVEDLNVAGLWGITTGWPAESGTRAGGSCAGSSPTRPSGAVANSSLRIGSTPARKPAPTVAP
jgi:putative transposase